MSILLQACSQVNYTWLSMALGEIGHNAHSILDLAHIYMTIHALGMASLWFSFIDWHIVG